MRLLVFGGTSFVGRAVVEAAVDRGWSVTTFNRGLGSWHHPAVRRVLGDRLQPSNLEALRGNTWDAVVDTWSAAPRAVRDSVTVLAGRAGRYVYVSSRSVYASPTPPSLGETAPTVPASPDAEVTEYPQDKRGGELAVEAGFGERSVLARAGLILGPHENVGRLPYWLLRIARGGEVLAPGPPDVPVRFIDARDLAVWLLDAAEGEFCGPVNLVNPPGHATMGRLLEAALAAVGGDARLVWVDPEAIEAAGIHRWTELPLWLPPGAEFAGLLDARIDRALATGLRCRSVEATVQDTWAWLVDCGLKPPPAPPDRPPLGLDPGKEARALDAWRGNGQTS